MTAPASQIAQAATAVCPACEAPGAELSFAKNGYGIHSCRSCGAEFLHPQPSDAVLASIYGANYRLGVHDARSEARFEQIKRATAALYLEQIGPPIAADRPRLLEIGCGTGEFLAEAAAGGFEVEGIEYSAAAGATVNRRQGREIVRVATIETIALPAEYYHVVASFDVIEHVRNPRVFLEHVHACLKPRGALALVTPSLDNWSRRLLGRNWMEYKTEHLTYFSQHSLLRLLERTGFADVRFFPNYKVLTIDYLSHHFDRFPVPVFTPLLRSLRRLLPEQLVHRRIKLRTSGMLVLTIKR